MPLLLLLLFSLVLFTGAGLGIFVVRLLKHQRASRKQNRWKLINATTDSTASLYPARRPNSWLAVKSDKLLAVQCALGLHNAKPCSWKDGLEQTLFIAPPVQGWVLIFGSGLPDPGDDIDDCYRFVMDLSRKLGQVQFFTASRILHHHAWIKVDKGRVVRAYAWAGRTVWKQGMQTTAEVDLDLRCFDYLESLEQTTFGQPDVFATNVEKVHLLAARWSVDPALLEQSLLPQENGISGERPK